MKHRSDAISKLLEGLDTIVAGHAKRTLDEDKEKKSESEGEESIESTSEHVEDYEVEANLPEGHSEEEEEEGAERAGKGAKTGMPEAPESDQVAGNGSGMPMEETPEHSPIHVSHGREKDDEMEEAKKELMNRLSKKPKAIRR